jgi:hypothetical protein
MRTTKKRGSTFHLKLHSAATTLVLWRLSCRLKIQDSIFLHPQRLRLVKIITMIRREFLIKHRRLPVRKRGERQRDMLPTPCDNTKPNRLNGKSHFHTPENFRHSRERRVKRKEEVSVSVKYTCPNTQSNLCLGINLREREERKVINENLFAQSYARRDFI